MIKNNKKSMRSIIEKKIEDTIVKNHLIQEGDKIVVAVSGGPDSMCLLDTLFHLQSHMKEIYHIQYELVVAHVNHMIREESKAEKEYVKSFCDKIQVPFYYLAVDIPKKSKENKASEETYGRMVRYEFFEQVRKETNATLIATAHNLDDDVETILLNMIRGCALKGLTGMGFSYKNIIRPLINIEKKDILEYNVEQDLNPCIDQTNFGTKYVRNRVRNLLIPTLKEEYNPNFVHNIIRMKHILEKEEVFLEKYTAQVVERAVLPEKDETLPFDFSSIMEEDECIKMRAIRMLIQKKEKKLDGIESIHVMDILRLLENNIKGKKYIMGNKFTIEITEKNIATIY